MIKYNSFKRTTMFLFMLFSLLTYIYAQGAGRALYFDGNGDYISLPVQNVRDLFDVQFTIEFWVNPGSSADRPTFGFLSGHFNKDNPISSYDTGLNFGDGNTYQLLDPLQTAPANTWTHYAIVDDGTNYKVYVNGFLVSNNSIQVDPNSNDSRTFILGDSGFDDPYDDDFEGYFEEFRIWDIGFTIDQIRENMCKKITTNDPNFSHLKCYLRFDESSGNIAYDVSNNNNNGTMSQMDASVNSIWSGAPIGDDVVYDATGTNPEDFTVTLSHPEGDYMVLTGDGGTVTAVYLYRVDDTALREDATIPNGWTIDHTRYWGVFVTGTNATYSLRYYYNQHSGITNSNDLILAYREDNNDDSWENSNAVNNVWKGYLDLSNQSGTEYALASENGENPLPVALAILTVSMQNSKPVIRWITESEINILGWNIYRSETQNQEDVLQINSNIIPGAGTTTQSTEYEYIDNNVHQAGNIYYYWLEYIEFSGSSIFYGPVSYKIPEDYNDGSAPIIDRKNVLKIYPNPFNPQTTIKLNLENLAGEFGELSIYNMKGELIKSLYKGKLEVLVNSGIIWNGLDNNKKEVPSGIYYCKLKTKSKNVIGKMLLLK